MQKIPATFPEGTGPAAPVRIRATARRLCLGLALLSCGLLAASPAAAQPFSQKWWGLASKAKPWGTDRLIGFEFNQVNTESGAFGDYFTIDLTRLRLADVPYLNLAFFQDTEFGETLGSGLERAEGVGRWAYPFLWGAESLEQLEGTLIFLPFVTFTRGFTGGPGGEVFRQFALPGFELNYHPNQALGLHLLADLFSLERRRNYKTKVGLSLHTPWPVDFALTAEKIAWDVPLDGGETAAGSVGSVMVKVFGFAGFAHLGLGRAVRTATVVQGGSVAASQRVEETILQVSFGFGRMAY